MDVVPRSWIKSGFADEGEEAFRSAAELHDLNPGEAHTDESFK